VSVSSVPAFARSIPSPPAYTLLVSPHSCISRPLPCCQTLTISSPPLFAPITHSHAGWSFPWGLRARLAELLLRGIFDTLDEGQYNDHRQELLKLLQGGVWRQLGITPDVHSAVFAWVHYRQFALSQELLLLEAACSPTCAPAWS
jgi:hypothetical protein